VLLFLTQFHSNSFTITNSWHGPASIAIKLCKERSRVQFLAAARDFFFSKMSGLAVEPTNLLLNGYRETFPWVKRLGHEADHSPQTTAEVKNGWSYTSTSPIHLHGIMHRDNFTFFTQFSQAVHLEVIVC
jgi:hypothetical protein